MSKTAKRIGLLGLVAGLVLAIVLTPAPNTRAADHGDAPFASQEREADIADLYAFLDPNDNTRLILAVTHQGFIVPGEAVNFGFYDPTIRFQIEVETDGDARPDDEILVSFGPRTSTTESQTASITLTSGRTFTARTTPPSLSATAPAPIVDTDDQSGVRFFAGVVDDPFFFDIPGFNRFVASARTGALDVNQLQRGRDTFAGYNVLGFALSIPLAQLPFEGDVIGFSVNSQTQTRATLKNGVLRSKGPFQTIDRMGNPAVNVVLIPFARKDEYNFAKNATVGTSFVANIVEFLALFGTDATSTNILADLAVTNGDYLRVDRTVANTGTGGGNNEGAGFPNGRRLGDDVVDTFLFVVANRNPLSDNANINDAIRRNEFPFYAPAHQPLNSGDTDTTEN